MELKNNELGWNKPNSNSGGSYDDSSIKKNIKEISSQLEHIENNKSDKTSYIDSTRDLEKLFNVLGENNQDKILIKKVNSDRYEIFIHHHEYEYQRHIFTREGQYFDNNVQKHANGDVFANELATLPKLKVQKNIENTNNAIIKSGTWTSSVANSIYSKTTDDYIETTFYGTECRLDVYSAINAGICRVQIDGQDSLCDNITLTDGQCLIDTYGSGSSVNYILAKNLVENWHTVKISVTGQKNENSSDTRIYFQNIRYWQPLFSQEFSTSQIIYDDSDSIMLIPSIVKELAINVNGAYRGFYHRYCYPKEALQYEIYIDGIQEDINIGEYVICNNVQFKQTAILYDEISDFGELVTISNYNSEGIIIKNKFTALRDFESSRFYPAMSGFDSQKIITSNCGEKELLKDESISNMHNDTSSILSVNRDNNYIAYTKFLYCTDGIIDNPHIPHFFKDAAQGYAKIYFVNNKTSFEKGYSYESIVRHSIRKCFGANML